MIGKTVRLNRLFNNESGNSILVAIDHGVTLGPLDGLRDTPLISNLAKQSRFQGVIGHKGAISWAVSEGGISRDFEYILHISGSTSLGPDSTRKEIVSSVEHGVRLGATAVSVHTNLGVAGEFGMLKDMARICDEAASWGMPVLVMINVFDEGNSMSYEGKKISHAVRVAAELGADLVKVQYPNDFRLLTDIVTSHSTPVLFAGGEKMEDKREWFKAVHETLMAGGKGLCVGRNFFQDAYPAQMGYALYGMVHEGRTYQEAYDSYESLIAEKMYFSS